MQEGVNNIFSDNNALIQDIDIETKAINTNFMLQGFFLNGIGWIDLAGKRQRYSAEISDTKSIYCNKDGWQIEVIN